MNAELPPFKLGNNSESVSTLDRGITPLNQMAKHPSKTKYQVSALGRIDTDEMVCASVSVVDSIKEPFPD